MIVWLIPSRTAQGHVEAKKGKVKEALRAQLAAEKLARKAVGGPISEDIGTPWVAITSQTATQSSLKAHRYKILYEGNGPFWALADGNVFLQPWKRLGLPV